MRSKRRGLLLVAAALPLLGIVIFRLSFDADAYVTSHAARFIDDAVEGKIAFDAKALRAFTAARDRA